MMKTKIPLIGRHLFLGLVGCIEFYLIIMLCLCWPCRTNCN